MMLAKSFGIIQDIVQKDGKQIYCGGEDMRTDGFSKSDNTFEGLNSCNHTRAGNDGFPSQSDGHNCGIFCLMYVAVKVLNLKNFPFDPYTFRYRLILYIMGLKYYQAGVLYKTSKQSFFQHNTKYQIFEYHERNKNLSCFMNIFSIHATKAKQVHKLLSTLYNQSILDFDSETEAETEDKKPASTKEDQPPFLRKKDIPSQGEKKPQSPGEKPSQSPVDEPPLFPSEKTPLIAEEQSPKSEEHQPLPYKNPPPSPQKPEQPSPKKPYVSPPPKLP